DLHDGTTRRRWPIGLFDIVSHAFCLAGAADEPLPGYNSVHAELLKTKRPPQLAGGLLDVQFLSHAEITLQRLRARVSLSETHLSLTSSPFSYMRAPDERKPLMSLSIVPRVFRSSEVSKNQPIG